MALVGQLLDTPVTIVMPSDAPKVKIESTKRYGGDVLFYDRYTFAFAACRRYVDDLVTVSDDEIRSAMRILFEDVKIAVEPAGAAATAAVLGPLRSRLSAKQIGILVCGSIIDPETFVEHIAKVVRIDVLC